ncbi:Uncharacterised protein [Mycobacteroides abscessus subsp. abscessus]|nr:Uncharacterised protein [Mycobacteroides abscessus subsp. abscessus]
MTVAAWNEAGAMPVTSRLSSSRVNTSGMLSCPAKLPWARIMSERNTATGRSKRSCAARSNTSAAHLLLP